MSAYAFLTPSETMLVGKWLFSRNAVVADDTSRRTDFLITHALIKVAVDGSGWVVLYRDPQDSWYWELSYPDTGEHGGGAPELRCVNVEEVRRRYPMI